MNLNKGDSSNEGMDGGQIETMTEQQRTHDDIRRKQLSLSQRLDRVSIEHIKKLGNKLRSCTPKP